MEFITNMVRGQEEILRAAETFAIVIWQDATSAQNIEGYGGEGSRNVNVIAKAMKTAITGGANGPAISSHPYHIDIMDKQDGTPHFNCMRISTSSHEPTGTYSARRDPWPKNTNQPNKSYPNTPHPDTVHPNTLHTNTPYPNSVNTNTPYSRITHHVTYTC